MIICHRHQKPTSFQRKGRLIYLKTYFLDSFLSTHLWWERLRRKEKTQVDAVKRLDVLTDIRGQNIPPGKYRSCPVGSSQRLEMLTDYNPDAALIVAGDFNHQCIDFATRGINTLDHCYTPFKNSHRVESLPTFV